MLTPSQHQDHLDQINSLLSTGNTAGLGRLLNSLHPAEIAHTLEALPPDLRNIAWELVNPEMDGDILTYVNDEVRSGLIGTMNSRELIAATEGLATDDLADILPDLPERVITELLKSMDEQNRHRLEAILQYPEDTAGGLMDVESVTIRPDVTLEVVLRYIRFHTKLPDNTDNLIVINRQDKYLGLLKLTTLLTEDPWKTVSSVMSTDTPAIPVDMPEHEVAMLFEKKDLLSAPVVNENNIVVGRITIDDVVDVIREEADHSFMRQAGLDEEYDMFAPVARSTGRRAIWLGINLLTALLASWVIGLFGATIEKLVALAILMPIVASMGGIAGSQTLTLVTRGMALGQIGSSNRYTLLRKELAVGALNGMLWAAVVGILANMWFEDIQLGLIIGFAIFVNLVAAALAGALIPLLLARIGVDPALAGGVALTTITDVIGFFAFLGMAALFLV